MDEKATRAFFEGDLFAKHCGIQIEEVKHERAICSMMITPTHKNAGNSVQGGAIFTLGDVAFAVAANSGERRAVSLDNQISFIHRARGGKLNAIAYLVSESHKICFYQVDIKDELETQVAKMSVTGYYL